MPASSSEPSPIHGGQPLLLPPRKPDPVEVLPPSDHARQFQDIHVSLQRLHEKQVQTDLQLTELKSDFKHMQSDIGGLKLESEKFRHEIRSEFKEFRQEVKADSDRFRQEVKADSDRFRQEMKADADRFRQEMRAESENFRQDMRAESDKLRQDMKAESDKLRQDMKAESDKFRQDMKAEFDVFRQDMKTEFRQHTIDLLGRVDDRVKSHLWKWIGGASLGSGIFGVVGVSAFKFFH